MLLFLSSPSWGQLNPVWNVQSPEVANLGLYGKIPVSKYTGVPNIDVPIYTLKVGRMSIPLSFSYHLASVKPHTPGGCLGLGWSLRAGGFITRTVHGTYDEKCDVEGNEMGYYGHSYKLKNMDSLRFAKETDSLIVMGGDYKKCHDISADEFSFQFMNYSGNFYYNEDGGWSVVSDQDIRVEFDKAKDFMDLNEVSKRIKVGQWSRAGSNNRFFKRFTLVAPDGTKYVFGGLDAIEFSVPYYSRNNSDLIPTTWRLSKIVTPEKREVTFSYDASCIQCDLRYVPQKSYMDVSNKCYEATNTGIGRANFTGFLLFPVNLQRIETPNDTLEFVYYKDVGYPNRFYSGALYWSNTSEKRDAFYLDVLKDPTSQFSVFLGKVSSASDVRKYLINQLLHCIRVKNAVPRTYYFEYTYASRLLLSQFTVRNGLPDLIENIVNNPDRGEFLANYVVPDANAEDALPTYRFEYNTDVQYPIEYVLPKTDSWGYYVGGTENITDIPTFELVYPNLAATRALTLSCITYPTGGRTEFDYEQHNYAKAVSMDRTSLENTSGMAGGLRVAKITNIRSDGSIDNVRHYYYSNENDNASKSSGILGQKKIFHENYFFNGGANVITLCSMAGYSASVTNLNTPDVGYSCVIEELSDSLNNSVGYVKSYFSNFDSGADGLAHLDGQAFMSNCTGSGPSVPYSSNTAERGKLLREELYDKMGIRKKQTNYYYERLVDKTLATAEQRLFYPIYTQQGMPSYACFGWLYETRLYSWMPCKIEETTFYKGGCSMKKTQMVDYDNYRQKTKCVDVVGGVKGKTITYKYPYNFEKYKWMSNRHILNAIVEQTVVENDCQETQVYDYECFNNVPYVSQSRKIFGEGKAEKILCEVLKTDNYGNPVEVLKDGMHIVLVWGKYGQLLLAKIENLSLTELESALGKKYYNVDDIEQNRNAFTFAHVTLYKYNGVNQLESISKPDGTTDYFTYDFLGRLREVYYLEPEKGKVVKRIRKSYDYQYVDNSR